jgi:predicted nuclease of predicted toxin-antitoxin system
MGIARSSVRELRARGHDVEHLDELGLNEMSDPEVLVKAVADKRIVLTFDLDFGDLLAAGREELPSVIIVRVTNQRPDSVTPKLLDAIERFATPLSNGAVLIVEDTRCRLRRLPLS